MAVPQGPLLSDELEEYPAANNRSENTGKGVQQELPHRRNLLCRSWPTGVPYLSTKSKASALDSASELSHKEGAEGARTPSAPEMGQLPRLLKNHVLPAPRGLQLP